MRPKTTTTKVERLMTALYTTHHAALRGSIAKMVGTGYADDIIGHLGEKLCADPDLWDGNGEKVFGFLHSALKRLALNAIRDQKKHLHECDSVASEMGITEWKVWTDPSSSPEQIAVAVIMHEQRRALIAEYDPMRYGRVSEDIAIYDMLVEGCEGREIALRLGINVNTAHGALRRVRRKIEQHEERSLRAGGA